MNKLFIYGTLLNKEVQKRVYGRSQEGTMVELTNFTACGLNITREDGETVTGLVIKVDDDELQKIDDYESLGFLYKKIFVEIKEEGECIAYQLI